MAGNGVRSINPADTLVVTVHILICDAGGFSNCFTQRRGKQADVGCMQLIEVARIRMTRKTLREMAKACFQKSGICTVNAWASPAASGVTTRQSSGRKQSENGNSRVVGVAWPQRRTRRLRSSREPTQKRRPNCGSAGLLPDCPHKEPQPQIALPD